MSTKLTFFIGILGVGLFVVAAIVGGFLMENYSVTSQYISESYAIDTEYGMVLRTYGYIPSGILLTLFAFAASKKFPQSKLTKIGFYGLAVFYGMATILVGFFPCDSACNKQFIDPSVSQIIHNLIGFLTYIFVPVSMILIGIGLQRSPMHKRLSKQGITYGILSALFVYVLFSNPNSTYMGIYQRVVESIFVIWIITCAIAIKNIKPAGDKV